MKLFQPDSWVARIDPDAPPPWSVTNARLSPNAPILVHPEYFVVRGTPDRPPGTVRLTVEIECRTPLGGQAPGKVELLALAARARAFAEAVERTCEEDRG